MADCGDVCFYLHAHLPYLLGHGTWPHGSVWLYEAAAGVYLPLLRRFHDLAEEGVPFALGLGLTPPLAEQLGDPRCESGLLEYLRGHAVAAEEDAVAFEEQGEQELAALARSWAAEFVSQTRFFESRRRDLPGIVCALAESGHLEPAASCATHGYLPLLGRDDALDRQVRLGLLSFQRWAPDWRGGFWTPECAYRPARPWRRAHTDDRPRLRRATSEALTGHDVTYTFVDGHLLRAEPAAETPGGAEVQAHYNAFREHHHTPYPDREPYGVTRLEGSSLKLLARDFEANRQVWDGFLGYPGDPRYREFHRRRWPSGLRYWRVTGKEVYVGHKAPYEPEAAAAAVEEHAAHFVGLLEQVTRKASGERAVLALPFDCELFGHWWHEGPAWLERVLRGIADSPLLEAVTPAAALERNPARPVVLQEGSWGYDGFHRVWLDEHTADFWELVYDAEDRLAAAARSHVDEDRELARRFLAQAARELLLLESSDWPFLVHGHSAKDYARRRYNEHHEYCLALLEGLRQLDAGGVDPAAEQLLSRRESTTPFAWAAWEELR
jgi:1,4-alpha-glucan branching enzyme